MKYYGSAYDTNPARLAIMIKRSKKAAGKKRIYPTLLSTVLPAIAWIARIGVK